MYPAYVSQSMADAFQDEHSRWSYVPRKTNKGIFFDVLREERIVFSFGIENDAQQYMKLTRDRAAIAAAIKAIGGWDAAISEPQLPVPLPNGVEFSGRIEDERADVGIRKPLSAGWHAELPAPFMLHDVFMELEDGKRLHQGTLTREGMAAWKAGAR